MISSQNQLDLTFCLIRIEEDLTPGAFWFFVNTTFFRYDLLELLQEQSFEEWVRPIVENQNRHALSGSLNSCSPQNYKAESQVQNQPKQGAAAVELQPDTIVTYQPGSIQIKTRNANNNQGKDQQMTQHEDGHGQELSEDDEW